ncbi:MAG: CAP domain-containing protein, partial [Clostridia bacterium]|nr:CAP domain-containing protein [Clostridia bacterium]
PDKDTKAEAYEKEVIRLVNEIRAEYGLNELTYDWELARVARYKSQDMKDNNYFSHTSPIYGSPFQMMKSFGITYKAAAENIAKGQKTPEAVVNAWMSSSGHRANILNSSYTKIGVGYVESGNIWTQMFIKN